ncbi:MAG: putative DnaQ family exonuclease/DinG family helicase [Fibrobacteres bacterium]|nr:putative DnaQ family exonuclease/DinG family helicase [Fibrobacterota bacterium]
MFNPLRDFVAFDLETTGLERDTDEIIEIGAVRLRGGVIEDRMSCLVKSEKGLTALVESLTGIDTAMLEAAIEPREALEAFLRFSDGLPLVAHNSDFDSAFLEHALSKLSLPPLPNPVFDSLLLARVAWPSMASHRLESLVEKLGIPPQKAHRALPDAEQAAALWLKAEEKLAGYAPRTLAALARVLSAGPDQWRGLFGGSASEAEGSASEADIDAAALISGSRQAQAQAQSPAAVSGIKPEASSESLFASGKVAEAFASLDRPYQARAKQARMAFLAERAFKESRFLVVEAEPGTGRLLACLVPALRQAQARKRPVFIAVSGRGRLERVAAFEIPLLKSLFGDGIRVEPLKAPSSYLSPRKLAGVLAHPETRLSREERLAILPIITWLEGTSEGDISGNMGFNHERNRLLWSKLASDSYAAEPGSHAHAARERANRAQLVLLTHDLFLDDLALDFALLPTYEAIVFDEAHRFPEAAQTRLGREVSFFRLKHILQTLAQSKQDASGLLAELERTAGGSPAVETHATDAAADDSAAQATGAEPGDASAAEAGEAAPQAHAAEPKNDLERLRQKVFEPERQLQKFFNKIAKHAQKRRKDGENRIRYADKLVVEFNAGPEAVITSISDLEALLGRLAETREDLAPDLRKTADLLKAFRTDLEHLAHPSGNGEVFWIEDFPNPHRALIRSANLNVGALLAEKFYPQMDAILFASPAIALGDEFKFFCRQLGLETAFPDRLKTALVRAGKDKDERPDPIFIARFSPVLSNNGALQAMGQILIRGLQRFMKPSFALFTHIGMLKQARAILQEGLSKDGRMVVAQHVDGSRENLLHLFRNRPDACLLGTESFVETLAQSDSLPEIVIVTKLPFPVPTEPTIAPHLERLQEEGKNPLYEYLLPCSILRLKQELNRLPRRPGRKLAIWIMDPRLATEKYARFYQRSLGRDAIVCDTEADLFARTAAAIEPGGDAAPVALDPVADASGEEAGAEAAEAAGSPASAPAE